MADNMTRVDTEGGSNFSSGLIIGIIVVILVIVGIFILMRSGGTNPAPGTDIGNPADNFGAPPAADDVGEVDVDVPRDLNVDVNTNNDNPANQP